MSILAASLIGKNFGFGPLDLEDANYHAAYRMLKEGETIRESDEFLDDSGVWRKTICAGEPAPNPEYTAHRQYRRLKDMPNDSN